MFKTAAELHEAGIKTVASIGRRQPMHIMHQKTLQRIVDAGFRLLVVVGSTNSADDPLYNPIKNPLNFEQQIQQIRHAMPNVDMDIVPLDDVGDLEVWCQNLRDLLPEGSAVHFMGKGQDKSNFSIRAGREFITMEDAWEIEALPHFDVNLWLDNNWDGYDPDLSATDLREVDLNNPQGAEKLFATFDYVKSLCEPSGASPLTINNAFKKR